MQFWAELSNFWLWYHMNDMVHNLMNKVKFDHFRWTSGIFAVSLCFLPLSNSIEIHDLKITGFERQSGVIFLLRKLKSQVQMAHLTLGFFWNLLNDIPIEIQWDHNSNSKYNWDHLKEKTRNTKVIFSKKTWVAKNLCKIFVNFKEKRFFYSKIWFIFEQKLIFLAKNRIICE